MKSTQQFCKINTKSLARSLRRSLGRTRSRFIFKSKSHKNPTEKCSQHEADDLGVIQRSFLYTFTIKHSNTISCCLGKMHT